MTPVALEHAFDDCEWLAVAVQLGGGPGTYIATTVTFCDVVKPWSGEALLAVPEKCAPF